ncbi:hypothetical protein G5I_13642 [Acromyrmex echinatior]|uniref:Uncharacterized protein n=1 Tax=Acromyrmex echinatior TaxID=103372 RepID=F4X5K8_ACREC|nr:hypothetical protein G5I_13642 [Acromyrmex echinatior]
MEWSSGENHRGTQSHRPLGAQQESAPGSYAAGERRLRRTDPGSRRHHIGLKRSNKKGGQTERPLEETFEGILAKFLPPLLRGMGLAAARRPPKEQHRKRGVNLQLREQQDGWRLLKKRRSSPHRELGGRQPSLPVVPLSRTPGKLGRAPLPTTLCWQVVSKATKRTANKAARGYATNAQAGPNKGGTRQPQQ